MFGEMGTTEIKLPTLQRSYRMKKDFDSGIKLNAIKQRQLKFLIAFCNI